MNLGLQLYYIYTPLPPRRDKVSQRDGYIQYLHVQPRMLGLKPRRPIAHGGPLSPLSPIPL